jgi:hypothetical protein
MNDTKVEYFRSLCLLLLGSSLVSAQYRLEPVVSPVMETERQTAKAFSEWRQRDDNLLRGVLTRSPGEAKKLVAETADSARQYLSNQRRYFEVLRADIRRTLSDVETHADRGGSGGLLARREEVQREFSGLVEEDRRLTSALQALDASSNSANSSAIRGILETEQQTLRDLRDTLALQLGRLDTFGATDTVRDSNNRELVQRLMQLEQLFDGEVENANELEVALADYYRTIGAFMDAREARLTSMDGPQGALKSPPGTEQSDTLSGVWNTVQSKSTLVSGPQPRRILLAINDQDGYLTANLSYWNRVQNPDARPNGSWSFAGKRISSQQKFEFTSSANELIKLYIDSRVAGELIVTWTASKGGRDGTSGGPFKLYRDPGAMQLKRGTTPNTGAAMQR